MSATSTPTVHAPSPAGSTDPSTVASAMFEHLAAAWNRADGAAFGEVFAAETDFVNIRGEHHRGDSRVIGAAHQALFDSIYAGSVLHYRVDVARPLEAGILAVVSATLDAPTGPIAGTNRSRITAVLTRESDRWVISAFHNTLVASPN